LQGIDGESLESLAVVAGLAQRESNCELGSGGPGLGISGNPQGRTNSFAFNAAQEIRREIFPLSDLATPPAQAISCNSCYADRVVVLDKFKGLHKANMETILSVLEKTSAPAWLIAEFSGRRSKGSGAVPRKRLESVLLTWNGSWGIVPELALDVQSGLASVKAELIALPYVQDVFAKLRDQLTHVALSKQFDYWGCCLEISPESFAAGAVRVHAHAFVKFGNRVDCSGGFLRNEFKFMSSTPVRQENIMGVKHRGTGLYMGLYYILAPKTSTLLKFGTKLPFSGFPVNPTWIFNLPTAGKISFEDARAESIRIPGGLVRRLADLDKWHTEFRASSLKQRRVERGRCLSAKVLEIRTVPEIVAWVERYSGQHHQRKKTLVLDGESGMGKTEYIRQLFGSDQVFEVNLKRGGSDFSLRSFDESIHKCILFDELHPDVVLDNRKLFQCQNVVIELGQSPTGTQTYEVWLNDVVIVICSNCWETDVAGLDNPADRRWLQSNCEYVKVLEKLWKQPGSPRGSGC
jgi:hypothetical protein